MKLLDLHSKLSIRYPLALKLNLVFQLVILCIQTYLHLVLGVTGRGGISFLFDKAVSNQTLTTSFVIEHTRLSDALVLGYPVKSISVSFTVGIISLNSPFYYNF